MGDIYSILLVSACLVPKHQHCIRVLHETRRITFKYVVNIDDAKARHSVHLQGADRL